MINYMHTLTFDDGGGEGAPARIFNEPNLLTCLHIGK